MNAVHIILVTPDEFVAMQEILRIPVAILQG
jgi:hypothetical protein